jgi:hypothetical protein
MRILHDFAMDGQRAPSLAVLLPGALQRPEEFVSAGFVDAVRRRKLPLDLALPDPDLQFVGEAADGTAVQRIHDNVMLPAHGRHYDQIWLAGISIGGFMAIAYADRYPETATGLCLLAPYPGNRIVTGEIAAAGGLLKWQPENLEGDDAERRIWQWMKARPASMQVHLGFGLDDRFAAGHRLMAEALPEDCVDTAAGGHEWPVWLQLWENFLDRRIFPAGTV